MRRASLRGRPAAERAVADRGRPRRLRSAGRARAAGDRRAARRACPSRRRPALVAAMARIETLLGRRAATRRGCCASRGPATSAGWSRGTARCMPRNTASMRRFEALVAQVAGGVPGEPRSGARALLDRRARRGERRLGVPGARDRRDRQAAPAAGRAGGARAGHRPAAGRRVHRLRPRRRLPAHHAVDQRRADRGAAIYQAAGFRLVASKPHSDFGPPMVGEDWELDLHA